MIILQPFLVTNYLFNLMKSAFLLQIMCLKLKAINNSSYFSFYSLLTFLCFKGKWNIVQFGDNTATVCYLKT